MKPWISEPESQLNSATIPHTCATNAMCEPTRVTTSGVCERPHNAAFRWHGLCSSQVTLSSRHDRCSTRARSALGEAGGLRPRGDGRSPSRPRPGCGGGPARDRQRPVVRPGDGRDASDGPLRRPRGRHHPVGPRGPGLAPVDRHEPRRRSPSSGRHPTPGAVVARRRGRPSHSKSPSPHPLPAPCQRVGPPPRRQQVSPSPPGRPHAARTPSQVRRIHRFVTVGPHHRRGEPTGACPARPSRSALRAACPASRA